MRIERYAVHWVNLDPVVVCPLANRVHLRWPFRVQSRIAGKAAEVAVDEIRTASRQRIGRRIGALKPAVAATVRHVVAVMYGVPSVSAEDR